MFHTGFMRWIRWYSSCPWSWRAKWLFPLLTRGPTQDSSQTRVDISMLFILFTSHLLLWFCSHDAAIDVFPLRIWKCALPRNLCDYGACCFVSQYSPPRNYLGKLSSVRNIADSTAEMGVRLQRKCSHVAYTKHMKNISNIWLLVGMQKLFKSSPSFAWASPYMQFRN